MSKTKIKVKETSPRKNYSNHWSKSFQEESLQQFLIKFNLSSLFGNCFGQVNWSTRESNLFLVIKAKWFLYLILSKRFFHPSDSDLPPEKYQFRHSLSPIVSTFQFFSSQLCQMSLFVSYSSIFKCLKVLKRLKQAKARMQKRRRVSESDMLWSNVRLDEWGI